MIKNFNIIGIITARMASTRFPGKPLEKILGMPMLGHVYYRSKKCSLLNEVYVATCDQEIMDYMAAQIGGRSVMTSDKHERASERCAEAMLKVEAETGKRIDIAVLIQGDEPMLNPQMIDDATASFIKIPKADILNLMAEIKTEKEFEDPNEVKVVIDKNDFALYFSREPIPSKKKYNGNIPKYKQLGIILFKRNILIEYIKMEPSILEIIESVDMNRFLEHGKKIKMFKTDSVSIGVDTPEDLIIVQKILKKDNLANTYI